jgi:hypothetical protein
VLGGLGVAAGAAGLGVAAGEVPAGASTRLTVPRGGAPVAGGVVPAVRTSVIGGPAFRPTVGATFTVTADGGLQTGVAGVTYVADLGLPSGSQVTAVHLVLNPGSASHPVKLRRYSLSPPGGSDLESNTTPGGTAVTNFVVSAGGLTIDAQSSYRIEITLQSMAAVLYGATVSYVAAVSAFVPLHPPQRVYDSRTTTAGKFAAGETRTVSFQQALGGVVPTAAIINLTVTNTEGLGTGAAESGGYVSVFPANIPWPGTSSINWKGTNQNVANAVITAVAPNDAVSVLCGVNRTDVVIDLVGYLL